MSNFLTVNTRDLLHGLVMVIVSAVLTSLVQLLQTGTSFGTNELKSVGLVALITGLTYLSKKLATDNEGKLMGKL